MIDSALIKWFQSVTFRRIKFARGITCFTGKSFAGKSAILRALRWALTNKPAGDSFVGKWRRAKFALVKLVIDGHTLTRKRGNGANTYKLDGKSLRAFGANPPQAVTDLAAVGPFNFQGQLDAPLWFTLSPPEVSRQLNGVVNLQTIDAALSRAAAECRKADAAVSVSEDRLRQAKADRDATAWAVELQADVERLAQQFLEIEKIDARASGIASAVAGVSRAVQARRNAAELILDATPAVRLAQRHAKLAQRVERLAELAEQLDSCTERLNTPIPSLDRLGRLRVRLGAVTGREQTLASIVHGLDYASMELESLTEQVDECQAEVKARVGATCPECGQPIRSPSLQGTGTSATTFRSPEPSAVRHGIKAKRAT